MRVALRGLVLAWAMGWILSQAQAGAPMATPSTFSVTPQGAASYQVPIQVAPGIAGVEPKLAFAYSSQGSNGIMGLGWSLTGLSSITRCPQTIAQDGTHGAVSFAATDRFCLDGKRLKLFNPNRASLQYWASGAANEYRTEIASFTRVVANGAAGSSGPAWFKVWTKSGEIIEYGNTPDSQITGNRSFTPLMWAVNKVSDRYGNYITFTYTQTTGAFEFYPASISYTGTTNPVQAANQQVTFSYEARPATDVISGYGPGGITVHTGQLLGSVQVLAGGGTLVRQYTLAYAPSSVSGRSTLQSIKECAPATLGSATLTCRPALTFDWPQGTGLLNPDPLFSGGSVGGWSLSTVWDYVADINGDGRGDLIRIWQNGSAAFAQVTPSVGGTSFTPSSNNSVGPWATQVTYCPPLYCTYFPVGFLNVFGDVNGDGKADLVRISNTGSEFDAQLTLSNGTGFNTATYNGKISDYVFGDAVPTYYDVSPADPYLAYGQTTFPFQPLLEDVNGDGRADLVLVGVSGSSSVVVTALSNGTSFTTATATGSGSSSATYEPGELVVLGGDVDGDGRADAIELFSQCQDVTNAIGGQVIGASCPTRVARLLISNGTTLIDTAEVAVGAGGSGDPAAVRSYFTELAADINGDGKTDLIRIRNSNPGSNGTAIADVWISTGTTLVKTGSYTIGTYGSEFFPIDVNGDGRTDLVVVSNNNGSAKAAVYLSNGTGFAATPDATWTAIGGWDPANIEDLPVDVNGDGRIDLVRLTNQNSTAVAQIATLPGTPFDVITAFGNGLGSTLYLNYQTIGEAGVPPPGSPRPMRMYAPRGGAAPGMPALTLYAKGSSSSYPLLDFSGPMKVVAWVETDSGLWSSGAEGFNNVSYGYSNGVIDLSGRGFLGFGQVQQQDNTANTVTTTTYSQTSSPSSSSFPYIGMALSKQTQAPLAAHTLLGTTTSTPAQVADDNGSPYPYIGTSVDQAYGLTTGNQLPTVTTNSVYDVWGNATQVTVTTTDPANAKDGFTTLTQNTYKPADTTNWILGRLANTTVTNTVSATPVAAPPSLGAFSVSVSAQSGGVSNSLGVITATATVTPSGGVAPIVYTWSGGSNGITASQTGSQATFSGNFSQSGVYSANFSLSARDAAGRVATVPSYTVTLANALATITPASTNWGTVGAASDSGDWFSVKNNGTESIVITAHAPVSGPAGVWSWQGTAGYCQPGTTVLAPGASCTTFFGMGGLATPGAYTATDQVTYQVQGITNLTFTIQQSYSFAVATTIANVTSLAFGNQALNTTSAPQSFNLINSATNGGPMYITGILMVGANPGSFPMSHNCGASIAAGASCTVTVQFSTSSSAGALSASLQVQGGYDRMQAGVDSGYRPTTTGVNFAMPVSGTSVAPPSVTSASFNPTSVDSGQTSTFSWNTSSAASASVICSAPAAGSGSGISGSISVRTSGTGTGTCSVTATNVLGATASGSANLTVLTQPPSVTGVTLSTARPHTLSFSVAGATSISYACGSSKTGTGANGNNKTSTFYFEWPGYESCNVTASNAGGTTTVTSNQVYEGPIFACPAVWQTIETKEAGYVALSKVSPGMHVRAPARKGWSEVYGAKPETADIWRLVTRLEAVDVNSGHWIMMFDDSWRTVNDLKAGDVIRGVHDEPVTVQAVFELGTGTFMNLQVAGQVYELGSSVGHNITPTEECCVY